MTGSMHAPDTGALLDIDEPGHSLLLDIHGGGFKDAIRAVKAICSKAGDRAVREQQTAARASALDELLGEQQQQEPAATTPASPSPAGGEDGDAEDGAAKLQAAAQHLNAMAAQVGEALQDGDGAHAAGPEPPVWQQAVSPVQELPPVRFEDLPQLQQLLSVSQQLLGLDAASSGPASNEAQAATFAWLLRTGSCGLDACPSAEAARLVFEAVCYSSDRSAALAAFHRLLAWAGVSQAAASSELCMAASSSGDSSSWQIGAQQRPPVTLQWLPSAGDLLAVFAALGCTPNSSRAHAAQGTRKQRSARVAAARAEGVAADSQQQQQGRCMYDHLPLVLRLLCWLCNGHAAGRLDMSGLAKEQARFKELVLQLLALTLDQQAVVVCRAALPEALAAALLVPDDSTWDRVLPSLLEGMSQLGPSHRATVRMLGALPRSPRCTQLQQWGALQLAASLVPGAPKQAPPQRGASGRGASGAASALPEALLAVLGPREGVRKLVLQLSGTGAGAGSRAAAGAAAAPGLQVWRLLSILDAADLLLWVDVSTPAAGAAAGVGVQSGFVGWLEALDKAVERKAAAYSVRSRLAAMRNAYEFAQAGWTRHA